MPSIVGAYTYGRCPTRMRRSVSAVSNAAQKKPYIYFSRGFSTSSQKPKKGIGIECEHHDLYSDVSALRIPIGLIKPQVADRPEQASVETFYDHVAQITSAFSSQSPGPGRPPFRNWMLHPQFLIRTDQIRSCAFVEAPQSVFLCRC